MKHLIINILLDKGNRNKLISEFQYLAWNSNEDNDIIVTIAHDLDYYEPNEEHRKEDPSFYGDEKLEEVIMEALKDLEADEETDKGTSF
jgi:hypothetical protein